MTAAQTLDALVRLGVLLALVLAGFAAGYAAGYAAENNGRHHDHRSHPSIRRRP